MPYVARVAVSNLVDFSSSETLTPEQEALKGMTHLNVFGNDYDTHDGSGVRDFIHVMDLVSYIFSKINSLIIIRHMVIY